MVQKKLSGGNKLSKILPKITIFQNSEGTRAPLNHLGSAPASASQTKQYVLLS
jgi:hypothetical protein